ncbi:MAG: PGF-CTERM sorting domain-containing protein [Methanophagales archaeon]|nr:PGF-CTERM sorting domain-containing protein [Methanophagales archaeon]
MRKKMNKNKANVGSKAKAMIGLAMVAIMVGSLLGAVVPMQAQGPQEDHARYGGVIGEGAVLFAGEEGLRFDDCLLDLQPVRLVGAAGDAEDDIIDIANASNFHIPVGADAGRYYVQNAAGVTIGNITIDTPEVAGNIFLGPGTIDSIIGETVPAGTPLTIRAEPNFGGFLTRAVDEKKGWWGTIEVDIRDPDGIQKHVITSDLVGDIHLAHIDADATIIDLLDINTTDWATGTYRIRIESNRGTCNALDVRSAWMEITIVPEVFGIEAVEEEVIAGEDMILRVRGLPRTWYYLTVTPVIAERPVILGDVGHVDADHIGLGGLAAWVRTGGGGVADIRISTEGADERTYTIYLFRGLQGYPTTFIPHDEAIDKTEPGDRDSVDVEVVDIEATIDVPRVAVIGEDVTIKVTATGGDTVDIIIDDRLQFEDEDLVDGEVEVEWDTGREMVGTYLIEVVVDKVFPETEGEIVVTQFDPDATASIRLVEPGLTAEQPRNIVAEGDDYTLEGTATGVTDVDYILIGPRGWRTETGVGLLNGISIGSISVTNNTFSEDIKMTDGLDTGRWIALVLTPGRDGEYETRGQGAGELTLGHLGITAGATQDQLVSKITDRTVNVPGGDDLLVALTFMVESARVELDEIAAVAVGDPLNVSGTTNREPGTLITISSIVGPMDLPIEMATVEWPTPDEGVFSATIDTTGMVPGMYTIEADDGDGNIDTVVVELLPEVPVVVPDPAEFTVANLVIRPAEVEPGETVTIRATVTNIGDEEGTHTLTLTIDGREIETRDVTLAGDATETVTFTVTKDVEATYSVEVDGLTDNFVVAAPVEEPPVEEPPVPGVPGFGAVLAIAGLLAVAYLVLRRKRR